MDNWLIESNHLMTECNQLRQEFYNKCSGYYRQSLYSNYTSEDELIEMLQKLKILRTKLMDISDLNYPNTDVSPYKLNHSEIIRHIFADESN